MLSVFKDGVIIDDDGDTRGNSFPIHSFKDFDMFCEGKHMKFIEVVE